MEVPMHANATATALDRAIDQMLQLDLCYDLQLWPADIVADRRHDLHVMWRHDDLHGLATELVAADQSVLLAHTIVLPLAGTPAAPGAGVDWPLIDRRRVAQGRFLVLRRGKEAAYRHLLRLAWNRVPPLARAAGDACAAGPGAELHVGRQNRRRLVVTRTGPRFAFADFADGPAGQSAVFLLPQFAPPGLTFQVGQHLTAVVVCTSRGLQARAIAAA
jgi:hypothetical protein